MISKLAADFLKQSANAARPIDMLPFLDAAKREVPPTGDEI